MAASVIDKVVLQARLATPEELQEFYNNTLALLHNRDTGSCVSGLRQLFVLLHSTRTNRRTPEKLQLQLVSTLLEKPGLSPIVKLLCGAVLKENAPSPYLTLGGSLALGYDETQVPAIIHITLNQGCTQGHLQDFVPQLIRWVSTVGYSSVLQSRALSALVTIATLHRHILSQADIHIVSSQLADWLHNASLYMAPNPYSRGLFKSRDADQQPLVTEIDGASVSDFFTVLCIGKYYTEDQMMNIHSFSLLYQWLLKIYPAKAPSGGDHHEASVAKFGPFRDKAIEYCSKILEQCDRKSKAAAQQDAEIQLACRLEAIHILDELCEVDPGLVPTVFELIKRLLAKTTYNQPRTFLAIMQFCLNHSERVGYDANYVYETCFNNLLQTYYPNPAVAFDMVMFLQDNLETLCYRTLLLTRFFPNILKIIAWNPRTYLQEFQSLLPAFIAPSTALEVFHLLLDLPCVTASLELSRRLFSDTSQMQVSTDPNQSSAEAFKNPLYVPMFNFILRTEGGFGDTIDRLHRLHEVLSDMCQSPRVRVCALAVPHLLRLYFEVIEKEGDLDLANKLVPVMMERAGLLYDIKDYQVEVKRLFSDYLVVVFKKYPCLMMDQYSEILEYVGSIRNITDREDFFVHLVWIIGEYMSSNYDSRCTPEMISTMYEALEALAYEVLGSVQSHGSADGVTYSSRLLSAMMSAIAKLASRCQDLIPRVMLCLTKLSQPVGDSEDILATRQALADRASELINLLRIPNVAALVLSPAPEMKTGRWHTDNTSLPVILQTTAGILQHEQHS